MKNTTLRLIFSCCLVLLINGCANAPKKQLNKQQIDTANKNVTVTLSVSEKYISLAQQAHLQQDNSASINYLLLASEALISQKTALKNEIKKNKIEQQNTLLQDNLSSQQQALLLAEQLSALVTTASEKYRLTLVKAQALLSLNHFNLALMQLDKANELAQQSKLKHYLKYYQTLAVIQQTKGLVVAALNAKMHAFVLNSQTNDDDIAQIWQSLTRLSQWQLALLAQKKPPYSKGWLALIHYANRYGSKPQQFNRYLINWRRHYNTHPANSIIPLIQQKLLSLQTTQVNNIAILLPLTGKQQAAGIAAQQGILAAYKSADNKQLFFIDTNNLNWQTLPSQLNEQQIDHVIGPLLKANVNNYLNDETLLLPTLFLNLSKNKSLQDHQAAISMSPDDEAIQAADTLSKRTYQHPLIISDSDKVSERISQRFAQQWLKQRGKLPEIFYLPKNKTQKANGKQRQKSLQASLDVSLSKARIKNIKSRLKRKIKTQARNRRDIDMIYLVSNSQKTRLLKPYIDVSISPFADLIPIFASSRSHSSKIDRQSIQDLNGLTFTEIPWLLTSKQQNKTIAQQSLRLWPQRSDSLQSIFALGFDSLTLITKLPLMQQAPYIHHFGQTGVLKYNNNNILTRSLLWGTYRRNKVQAIVME